MRQKTQEKKHMPKCQHLQQPLLENSDFYPATEELKVGDDMIALWCLSGLPGIDTEVKAPWATEKYISS